MEAGSASLERLAESVGNKLFQNGKNLCGCPMQPPCKEKRWFNFYDLAADQAHCEACKPGRECVTMVQVSLRSAPCALMALIVETLGSHSY